MLSDIINSGLVWRPTKEGDHSIPALDTGYAALNGHLVWGGWPLGSLCEVIYPIEGSGEISLLQPIMSAVSHSACVVCLGPPHDFYLPGLSSDLNTSNLLVLKPEPKDELWAAEQALRSGCCKLLLMWPSKNLSFTQYRRLQILCSDNQAIGFIMMRSEPPISTPSRLRLSLQRLEDQEILVSILKHQGGYGSGSFKLALSCAPFIRYPVSENQEPHLNAKQGNVWHMEQ